jgi:hypothetical protein
MSIAFRNSGYSKARKGRFEVIKNTISYSLQAVGVNFGISFLVEAYAYYQFVYLALRIIHLLRNATRVLVHLLSRHISYARYDAGE